ncbi:MAG: hypothetical protein IPJ30_14300 [Acidobacteria bacterium]|nr:hypothetical protein [Acidobacteriota bacterium]
MSYLVEQGGTSNLILDKQGAGRLYYRIGMKYAPKSLKLAPADYGFTVLRKYEAVDDPEDVKQNPDGTWTFKAGARVRVKLTMVAPGAAIPRRAGRSAGGLEILNPGLATTESIPGDNQYTAVVEYGSRSYGRGWYYWKQYWFEHQNFRDERAESVCISALGRRLQLLIRRQNNDTGRVQSSRRRLLRRCIIPRPSVAGAQFREAGIEDSAYCKVHSAKCKNSA